MLCAGIPLQEGSRLWSCCLLWIVWVWLETSGSGLEMYLTQLELKGLGVGLMVVAGLSMHCHCFHAALQKAALVVSPEEVLKLSSRAVSSTGETRGCKQLLCLLHRQQFRSQSTKPTATGFSWHLLSPLVSVIRSPVFKCQISRGDAIVFSTVPFYWFQNTLQNYYK